LARSAAGRRRDWRRAAVCGAASSRTGGKRPKLIVSTIAWAFGAYLGNRLRKVLGGPLLAALLEAGAMSISSDESELLGS
jgi:hypothetical protein